MGSPIDECYRLILLEHYLDNAVEAPFYGAIKKWVFVCPFCGPLGSTASKKKHRKAALLWNAAQHSWVFSCAKKGSIICTRGMTLGNFIRALNPALALVRHARGIGGIQAPQERGTTAVPQKDYNTSNPYDAGTYKRSTRNNSYC